MFCQPPKPPLFRRHKLASRVGAELFWANKGQKLAEVAGVPVIGVLKPQNGLAVLAGRLKTSSEPAFVGWAGQTRWPHQ